MKSRTKVELDLIRRSGEITSFALKNVLKKIKVGVSARYLNERVEKDIRDLGGKLAFTSVDGYRWGSCITFNSEVVHGIPSDRKIESGDLVSVDLGSVYQGWFTDAAWTVLVDGDAKKVSEKRKFLQIGEEALWEGIKQAVDGNRVGDISASIQKKVEGAGYSIVRSLVGHGVGRALHENPEIPGFGKEKTGLVLREGMSLAIEVIYTEGSPEVILEKDGWTVSSADGSLGGLFEMTVIVGKNQSEVITDWRK